MCSFPGAAFLHRYFELVTACLACLIIGGVAAPARSGEGESRRFREEFPEANSQLAAFFATVQGSGNLESTAGDRTIVYRVDFAVDGNSRKVYLDALTQFVMSPSGPPVESKRESQRVYCIAPDVKFSLFRANKDQPFILSEFGDEGPEESVSIYLDRYLMAPHAIFGISMAKIMADPTFKVRSVDTVREGEEDYLKISFDFAPKTFIFRSGWVVVSPRDGWAIVKADCQMGDKPEKRLVCDVEYGERTGGVRYPKRVSYTLPGPRHSVFEFSKIVAEPTAANEFTLAAHGLPDLTRPAVGGARSSTRYWLFLLAFLALAIAVAMKYGAGRLRRE